MTPTKSSLLTQIRAARAELESALAGLTPAQIESRPEPQAWSVKDTLAHIALWEQMLVRYQLPGQRGHEGYTIAGVHIPEFDVDDINGRFQAAWRDRPLAEVQALFARSHQETLAAIEACPETRLAATRRYPDEPGDYPVVEVILSETVEHYLEHLEEIRHAATR